MSKIKFKLLEGSSAINAAIKSIDTRGKALQRDIHVAAVSVVNHIELHGDITLADTLLQAMPASSRRNALIAWMVEHSKADYNAKEKKFVFNRDKTTKLEEAIVTPFWDFMPEPAYVPYDVQKAILAVIKRAEADIAKGNTSINAAVLDKLAALATESAPVAAQADALAA